MPSATQLALVAALLLLGLAASQMEDGQPDNEEHMQPPQWPSSDHLGTETEFVDEPSEPTFAPDDLPEDDDPNAPVGDQMPSGEGRVGGLDAQESECARDPTSAQCEMEKNVAAKGNTENVDVPSDAARKAEIEEQQRQAAKDAEVYASIVLSFETASNEWACAVTARPLFNVSGDADLMNYLHFFLAHVFSYEGQRYGATVVSQFHEARDMSNASSMFSCDEIELGDTQHYAAASNALLQLKSSLTAWLSGNEVDPRDVVDKYVPQAKVLYTKWLRSRMLFHVGRMYDAAAEGDGTDAAARGVVAPEALLAIMPLFRDEEHPKEECSAASELWSVHNDTTTALGREIDRMLDLCLEHGRLADDPTEFGGALLRCHREAAARDLFDVAVERGALCHAYQRPEMHHRRDLAAAASWDAARFPQLTAAAEGLQAAARAELADGNAKVFRGDHTTMQSFLKAGAWERTTLYGQSMWNESLCGEMKTPALCDAAKSLVEDITAGNDGYMFACNGSLNVEFWNMAAGTETHATTGATNIVLHALLPVAGSGTLVAQLGEEAVRLAHDEVTPLVIDDTFENTLRVVGGEDGSGLALLHVQLCHPDLHAKAMDTPSNTCAAPPQ